mgnify:CR=1 FL=1
MPTGGLKSILNDTATPENVIDPSDLTMKWKGFVWDPYDASRMTYDWLKANCSGPHKALFLGYTIGGSSHINVIGHYDLEGTPYVWAGVAFAYETSNSILPSDHSEIASI